MLPFVLKNSLEHDGKASFGSIMGKAMTLFPDLKKNPEDAARMVKELVNKVNSMTIDQQMSMYSNVGKPVAIKRRRREGLPDLEDAEQGKVIMRFAPGPSGPLHIGHTRAAVLNDLYCKRYDGRFILRLEDTNPDRIELEAYDMIQEDLEWLGVKVDDVFIQSDRFDIYYKVVEELIKRGHAYICTMDPEQWRQLKAESVACPERDMPPNHHMEGWANMLDGTLAPGEASLVVKTDLEHKNPAVRDFVGMRINETPHPLTGNRYRVYPLYNLSVSIDDHLMGCTHILRGKDHLNNTYRQEYVYKHMGWELPHFIHYGLVSIPDTILKTSLIKEEISRGNYEGWDDVRTGTLRALCSRGIQADALRRYWKEAGMKSVDIIFSWDNLYAMNREIIEKDAKRYFFVPDPIKVIITGIEELHTKIPLFPDEPERGKREFRLNKDGKGIELFVPMEELHEPPSGSILRLKDLCNVTLKEGNDEELEYAGQDISEVRKEGGRIIQWLPPGSEPCRVLLPNGSEVRGLVEKEVRNEAEKGSIVQFERVGFFKMSLDGGIVGRFTHK